MSGNFTLGEIAANAYDVKMDSMVGCTFARREAWEAAATAVRNATIEECAAIAKKHADAVRKIAYRASESNDVQTASHFAAIGSEAESIEAAIRALKSPSGE